MQKRYGLAFIIFFSFIFNAYVSLAHFGVILPSDDIVEGDDSRSITLSIQFMHPFEQKFMEMEKPLKFGVVTRGKDQDLTKTLTSEKMGGHTTWKSVYELRRPGDQLFYVIPKPYWEPAEETFIQHYTKVIVNGFGLEEGWNEPVGLKTEIVPLTRPYGLWTGNLFCGQVLVEGKPAGKSDVEIEYYNEGSKVKAPAAPYVTQVVQTDEEGKFCYSMPKAGWWGFAALNEASEKLEHDGQLFPIELGAVIWVKTRDMR